MKISLGQRRNTTPVRVEEEPGMSHRELGSPHLPDRVSVGGCHRYYQLKLIHDLIAAFFPFCGGIGS